MQKLLYVLPLGSVLLLAGCDNSSGTSTGSTDSFTSTTANLASSRPDNTEPQSIDSISVTQSDTTEPIAVVVQ